MPRERPALLVFEDLHWADGRLAFLDAAEQLDNVPLLLLGTARQTRGTAPDFGRILTRIDLVPLTEAETGRLVSGLLDAALVSAEVQQPILERAGGNRCSPRSSCGSFATRISSSARVPAGSSPPTAGCRCPSPCRR